MQDLILYDSLSVSSKMHSAVDLVELLGLQELVCWEEVNGHNGAPTRLYYDGVSVNYGREDGWNWFELTGQGCRLFETFGRNDYDYIFDLVRENPLDMKITRLDIAFDDRSDVFDMDRLLKDTESGSYVSRFSTWKIEKGSNGSSIYFGSSQSEMFFRIYDKAAERGYTDGTHWIRFEAQLRRDRAQQFAFADGSIQYKYLGMVRNYLRFVEPMETDSNKRRWPSADFWEKFIQDALPLSLYVKPGVEYNFKQLSSYVYHQAGNAIDTLIQIIGVDEFVKNVKLRDTELSPKYKFLLEQEEDRRFKMQKMINSEGETSDEICVGAAR